MQSNIGKRYRIRFTDDELLKFNKIINDNKRKKAMSVLQYIIKNSSNEDKFLEISLNRLHKKFKRYHKGISLTYFKVLTKLLVDTGLLIIKKVGRLNFYGRNILRNTDEKDKEIIEKEKENKNIEIKEVKEISAKEKTHEFKVASKENVIETAYEIMNEVGIKTGSRTYFQVIESLYYIIDKKDIHINGMIKYIEKIIEDKVKKQSLFKNKLINIRNKMYKNIRFNDFKQRERSEKEWNNLEYKLLGWDK